MPEMVAEMKALSVYMKCDKCNKGMMEFTGNVLMSNPPLYTHRCNCCGYVTEYNKEYPYQKLVPLENLREPKEDEK